MLTNYCVASQVPSNSAPSIWLNLCYRNLFPACSVSRRHQFVVEGVPVKSLLIVSLIVSPMVVMALIGAFIVVGK